MSRFNDRLDPAAREDDVDVDFVVVAAGEALDWSRIPPEAQALLPERLFNRLRWIGLAYELYSLQNLHPVELNRLNRSQVESLIEEVEFVMSIVEDPALRHHIPPILRIAQLCLRSDKEYELLIEGP